MSNQLKPNELSFVAISGINYPTKHRPYLLKLAAEVAIKHQVPFVLVGGNTVDGDALQKEYKGHLKYELKDLQERTRELTRKAKELEKLSSKLTKEKDKEGSSEEADQKKVEELDSKIKQAQEEAAKFAEEAAQFQEDSFRNDFEQEFVNRHAQELDSLFPVIPGVNYHIAIAQKVYDKQIGVEILERLHELREDIRLIGEQEDGTYDPEPKVAHQLKGFGEIRAILPNVKPWFYRVVSSFVQRLVNGFFQRTFSPKPDLAVVFCTGTACYLPNYDGVPTISVPTLHKLSELHSTENMVGASYIRLIVEKDRKRVISGTYDFRPAIFHERQFSISDNTSVGLDRAVLKTLVASPASPKTIMFRIKNQDDKEIEGEVTLERILESLRSLIKSKTIVYNSKSNQYAISENQIQQARVSLASLFKHTKTLRETVTSCFHCGCLKTLYHTNFHYLPENAVDSDILVEDGDGIQGNAHAYDYNGELLPTMMAYDKQERTLAAIRRRNIMDIFTLRFTKFSEEFKKNNTDADIILDRCLIKYIFQTGNHPAWKYYQKHSLILGEFEETLKNKLVESILEFCEKNEIKATFKHVKALVESKVVRVGESFMVHTNGFVLPIKHPYKSRTASKSHRIQDVVDFVWRGLFSFIRKTLKDKEIKGFVIANIANFHEAAAVHVSKFGRTAFGLMTGAQVKDTRFESHLDKVVDYGTANALVVKDHEDRLLYSEVEFDDRIHPSDEKMVYAEHITTSDVLELCLMLDKEAHLPWRYY